MQEITKEGGAVLSGASGKKISTEYNFIRCVAAVAVVLFHFSSGSENTWFMSYGGIPLGWYAVNLFLVLSGSLLYKNYGSRFPLKKYFFKRWLSLYPSFYIAYILILPFAVLYQGSDFTDHNPLAFIFTLAGVDGYLANAFETFYIVGEWYLGGMVFLYVIYPLLAKCIDKAPLIAAAALVGLKLIFQYSECLGNPAWYNPVSLAFSFSLGIYFAKYKADRFTKVQVASIFIFLISPYIVGNDLASIFLYLPCVFLYLALYFVGKYAMRPKRLGAALNAVSGVSYEIFLVQHAVIRFVRKVLYPRAALPDIVWLFAVLLATFAAAAAIKFLSKKLSGLAVKAVQKLRSGPAAQ